MKYNKSLVVQLFVKTYKQFYFIFIAMYLQNMRIHVLWVYKLYKAKNVLRERSQMTSSP